jgi:protein O-GlcNAcase/histone acetyltransferase
VLFDDIEKDMHAEDARQFASLAHAHCFVANRLLQHLSPRRLLFCPTEYCSSRADPTVDDSEYLKTTGRKLDSAIQVMWTGDCVIPADITPESLQRLRQVICRKPVIWDNIHANDYDSRRVYLGPYAGRPFSIHEHIAGVLSNPNCEYTSNFIPLHTLGAWARLGGQYEERTAYMQALADWLPNFRQATGPGEQGVSTDELMLFCDLFYLPYDYGDEARKFLDAYFWLENADRDREWRAA